MSAFLGPDELSSPMIEAVLAFVDEWTPLRGLHHATEKGLVNRGLIERKPHDHEIYPTAAGMVLAGVLDTLWHASKRLVDLQLTPAQQTELLGRTAGMVPARALITVTPVLAKRETAVMALLSAVLNAFHPREERRGIEPDFGEAMRMLEPHT